MCEICGLLFTYAWYLINDFAEMGGHLSHKCVQRWMPSRNRARIVELEIAPEQSASDVLRENLTLTTDLE